MERGSTARQVTGTESSRQEFDGAAQKSARLRTQDAVPPRPASLCVSYVTDEDADRDLDVIAWSMRLASIRRYFHQRFWEQETTEAEFASRLEPKPRLESVAEHSW